MTEFASRVLEGPLLPPRLGDLPDPPARMHLVGEVPGGLGVAIVGTRTPSPEGRAFASALAEELARHGIAILSGGAAGIDTAAHEGALAGQGITLVVAPSGYRHPYPAQNAALFERIVASGGGHLSLYDVEVPAEQHFFFARNRCLAALAHAVVVVETRWRGGARNAAKWARRLGRPLLVVPSAPWIQAGAGCLLEIRGGAELCVTPRDVLNVLRRTMSLPPLPLLPPAGPAPSTPSPSPQGVLPFGGVEEPADLQLPPDALAVLKAVRAGARHLDAVCERSGLSPAVAQTHVLTLTLEGVLVAGAAGALVAVPAPQPVSARKRLK